MKTALKCLCGGEVVSELIRVQLTRRRYTNESKTRFDEYYRCVKCALQSAADPDPRKALQNWHATQDAVKINKDKK